MTYLRGCAPIVALVYWWYCGLCKTCEGINEVHDGADCPPLLPIERGSLRVKLVTPVTAAVSET